MRVIIAAAGPTTKWFDYLSTPPHLLPVQGEPLLARTVRQARTLTDDVHITTPDDERYAVPGATRHIRGPEGNEYTSTRALWSDADRTVLMLGDVYFTDAAVATIGAAASAPYRCFGRAGASRFTGCPYGEIFAASWGAACSATMDRHIAETARLRASGECTRPAGWVILRLWQGTPVRRHVVKPPLFVTINDLTDDIDKPEDYKRHPRFGGSHARR